MFESFKDNKVIPKAKPMKKINIPATTTSELPGMRIVKIVDVLSAEVVLGMNFIKDWFANTSDKWGGRNKTTQNELRRAGKQAISELKSEALLAGANAVVGVKLTYAEFSAKDRGMIVAIACGTAVQAQPIKKPKTQRTPKKNTR